MMRWSINLFRIRGIQLALHVSFLLWLGWWAYLGYEDSGFSGMFWSSAELVCFFTCVVLHELGHCFTGMRFGMHVRRILLMPIGGMAQFEAIPRNPRQEILMTIAGPAVNFAIAGLLWIVLGAPSMADLIASPSSALTLGRQLMAWNLLMGLFNLVPAFPMDGGRILRAVLALFLPYLQATKWAATIGKIVAAAAIAVALYFGSYITAILFTFILVAGEGEYRLLERQEAAEAHWRAMMEQLQTAPPSTDEPPLLKR